MKKARKKKTLIFCERRRSRSVLGETGRKKDRMRRKRKKAQNTRNGDFLL